VLVEHVQELQTTTISGGIGLEVLLLPRSPRATPTPVGLLSPVTPHRAIGGTCPLAFPRRGPLQAFLTPESLNAFVVHRPALPPQKAVGHLPTPTDVLSGDLTGPMELCLLDVNNLAGMALGAAVLPSHSAYKAFRRPLTILQNRDSPAAGFEALNSPQTPTASPGLRLEHRLLHSASARISLNRAFSYSSWVRRLASSACIPPYCCRQRW
jgi:hypothetical protein